MAESYTVVPLSPLRKVIAARMTEAKQTIPHFRLMAEIEMDELLAARERANSAHPESKLSVNDCIIKACATALIEHPVVDVQWAGDKIHQYRQADIAVVIAVPGGLATPVIRDADTKSAWEIAREVKALNARAMKNALRLDEIMGGSFSISNLGMYGVDQFDAIINPPQCAILAVGAAKPRLVASRDRETKIATILCATLSVDHRAIDGATGAEFLSTLRRHLEQPAYLRAEKYRE